MRSAVTTRFRSSIEVVADPEVAVATRRFRATAGGSGAAPAAERLLVRTMPVVMKRRSSSQLWDHNRFVGVGHAAFVPDGAEMPPVPRRLAGMSVPSGLAEHQAFGQLLARPVGAMEARCRQSRRLHGRPATSVRALQVGDSPAAGKCTADDRNRLARDVDAKLEAALRGCSGSGTAAARRVCG